MKYQKVVPGLIVAVIAPAVIHSQDLGTKQLHHSKSAINKYVKNLLSTKFKIPLSKLKPGTHLQNELGMDSIDAVELIMEIEKHLDCSIPDALAEDAVTVEKTVEMAVRAIELEVETKKINAKKKFEILDYYQEVSPFVAKDKATGKYGYLNKKEEVIIDFVFDKVNVFRKSNFFGRSHKVAWVKKDGKYNVINRYGKQLNTIQMDSVGHYDFVGVYADYMIGFIKGKSGVLNSKGELVIPFEYDKIRKEGHKERDFIFIAYQGDTKKLFTRFGKEIFIPDSFTRCHYNYDRGIIATYLNVENKARIEAAYDLEGNTIFKPGEFTFEVNSFEKSTSKGIELNWNSYLTYFYDEEGESSIGHNKHGAKFFATVKKNDKIGVVDTEKNIVVPFQSKYKLGIYIQKVDRVLAYDPKRKKFGYLNGKGEIAIPFKFKIAGNFRSIFQKFYIATIMIDGIKYGINENGNWIDGNGKKIDGPK